MTLAKITAAIEDFRAGKMVIIVDDEDRENEGDLVVAADFATPEAINFMATHGRGLICVPMTGEMLDRLELPMMVPPRNNHSGFGTGFTLSVEARDGVSTGISAFDRAHTISVLIDPESTPADIVAPGHMFPLRAHPEGVLGRRGQTEASVDLARLSGLSPAGVICEVMAEDGTMLRGDELWAYAAEHDLKIISVEGLVEYRQQLEADPFIHQGTGVVRVAEAPLPTKYGTFQSIVYKDLLDQVEHIVMRMGDPSSDKAVMVRVHSECLTGDIFGSARCDCGEQLELALRRIAAAGEGMVVYMRQEGRGIGLANKIKAYALQSDGRDTVEANVELGFPADARSYRIAAAILQDQGAQKVRLMTNNPAKIAGLREHGIDVTERISHELEPHMHNAFYMQTKAEKMGHLLEYVVA